MQPPTCRGIRVRSPSDAGRIFHGVLTGRLRMITRRLDTEERRAIHSGCVYVWEERGPNAEATGLGIERWTDSISWGPSRVRDEFLFYHERRPVQADPLIEGASGAVSLARRVFYRPTLIKQTYSVFVNTHYGRRKWHMIAYFTQETANQLLTVDDLPELANLEVPRGLYKCARNPNRGGRPPYVSTRPRTSPESSSPSGSSPEHAYIRPRIPLNPTQTLAPLEYLEAIAPPPRHAMDEGQLMRRFTGGLNPFVEQRSKDLAARPVNYRLISTSRSRDGEPVGA